MDFTSWTPETFLQNQNDHLSQLEKDKNSWTKIPFLNHQKLHEIKDQTLVRFRGMIQDMMEPEIYFEKYLVKSGNNERIQEGMFRDTLVCESHESVDYDSSKNVHGERRTMFVVTVPGLNAWASEIEKKSCPQTSTQTETNLNNSLKRSLEEDDEAMDIEDSGNVTKKLTVDSSHTGTTSNQNVLSEEYLLNLPIPERPGKACMIKVYTDFDSFPLNSIVDVIGFLSVNPALDGSTDDYNEFEGAAERQAANPPPSLIPRLHAIYITSLNHSNPLLLHPESLTLPIVEEESFLEIYKDLKIALTQCLFQDVIAADYLICHLISTVYIRTGIESLGQFSLNLCNIPLNVLPEYTNSLYEILELLLPASHFFPMTLENMNTQQFSPKKDYTTNKLTSGLLQLAPHTHLVLDETKLQPGKLEAAGVDAISRLAHLINHQKVKCNFQYYEIEFASNIPCLLLSEGRSMLPSNCILPVKPEPESVVLIKETFLAVKHFLQPKLNSIRYFLTKMKIQEFNMDTEYQEIIQNDFVEMRRENNKVNAEDLHSLLVLSRLLGLSEGKKVIDQNCWERAKCLEQERKSRIKEISQSRKT